jgi:hypothetical protein
MGDDVPTPVEGRDEEFDEEDLDRRWESWVEANPAEDHLDVGQLAEARFARSPRGRARAARQSGRRIFQVSIPVSETERTVMGLMSGSKDDMRHREALDVGGVLEEVELEGWRFESAGYVFEQTGSVSRDKLLSSGQTERVTGRLVGVYIFRATDGPPPPP